MRTPLALVLLATLVGPALAETSAGAPVIAVAQMARPRSVGDCEQVKGDLAYNQCLSMFGPAAHTKGAAAAGSGDGPTTAAAAVSADEPAVQTRRGRRGRTVRRGGRQSASFAVGGHGRHYGGHRRRHR